MLSLLPVFLSVETYVRINGDVWIWDITEHLRGLFTKTRRIQVLWVQMRHKTASCCLGLKLPLQASAEREKTLSTCNLWLSILHISTVNIDINIDTSILRSALQILLKSVEHSHDLSRSRFINSASDSSNLCFLRRKIPVIAGIWKAGRVTPECQQQFTRGTIHQ